MPGWCARPRTELAWLAGAVTPRRSDGPLACWRPGVVLSHRWLPSIRLVVLVTQWADQLYLARARDNILTTLESRRGQRESSLRHKRLRIVSDAAWERGRTMRLWAASANVSMCPPREVSWSPMFSSTSVGKPMENTGPPASAGGSCAWRPAPSSTQSGRGTPGMRPVRTSNCYARIF